MKLRAATILLLASALGASARAQPSAAADTTPAATGTPSQGPSDSKAPSPAAVGHNPADKSSGSASKSHTVSQVVVTAREPDVIRSADRKSYAVDKDLQASTGSIADVLRNLPSVQVDPEGGVAIRGDSNVTILIDGRPSGIVSAPGALLQIPASEFERVEVMTNPSAAFATNGSGAVINLIRRKAHKPGFDATVTGNVGEDGRENGSVRATYATSKLSLRASLSARRNETPSSTETRRTEVDPVEGSLDAMQDGASVSVTDSIMASGGADFTPDTKSRVSADVSYLRFDGRRTSQDAYVADDPTGLVAQSYMSTLAGASRGRFADEALSYVRKFGNDGRQLKLDFSHIGSTSDRRAPTRYTDIYGAPLAPDQTTSGSTAESETQLQAEFQGPLWRRSDLTLGSSLNIDRSDSGNALASGPSPSEEVDQPEFDNDFLFRRRVLAAYGTLQQTAGKLKILAGLRFENTHDHAESSNSNYAYLATANDVTPTLHFSYDLGRGQQLTASFSRRVQRPSGSILDPAITYVGPNSYLQGDSHLGPVVTDSFELGYDVQRKASDVAATLFYRDTDGLPTDVYSDLGGGTILTSFEPLGSQRDGGLELSLSNKLTRTIKFTVTATVMHSQIENAVAGLPTTLAANSYFGNGSLDWDITPKDLAQLSGSLFGKRLMAQGYMSPAGILNLGYRHAFSSRLALVVTADNVLGANRSTTVLDTPALREITHSRSGERLVFLGLVYSFGSAPRAAKPASFDYSAGSSGSSQ